MSKHQSLTIGWLYPSLMSTYGDRGNIICLKKRCEWRGIVVEVVQIESHTPIDKLQSVDLIFGGGSQDREQEIVMRDLIQKKQWIFEKVEAEVPALFVCGSPQLMGKYYEPAVGKRIEGLGLFNMYSIHPGIHTERCIGNIVAQVQIPNFESHSKYVVGFENHGGRTYLGNGAVPFAKVVRGYGNNGTDRTEGVVYKNAIGCYFHGPFLPKNPSIADFFIKRALEVKYKQNVTLLELDDTIERKAHTYIVDRLLKSS